MIWIIGTIYSVSWSLDEFDQLEKFNNKFGKLDKLKYKLDELMDKFGELDVLKDENDELDVEI